MKPSQSEQKQRYLNPLLETFRGLKIENCESFPPQDSWQETRQQAARAIALGTGLEGAENGSDVLTRLANKDYEKETDFIARIEGLPYVWLRANVASSLMDEAGYRLILDFSRGHVWDVGCGSGYHAFVLRELGAEVYATDRERNRFEPRFHKVHDGLDEAAVAEIAQAGGTALYFWAWGEYHGLECWLRQGGRRVITVGCFEVPDHFWMLDYPDRPAEEAPRLCPPFPPEGLETQFRLVATHTPPHYRPDDVSVRDVMQLFELVD
jgi:hypothetical protein